MVEALLVPASRPIQWMREAMGLAKALNATLIALCSQSVEPPEVAELGAEMGVTTIALACQPIDHRMPALATETLLKDTPLERTSDAHIKRNMALLLSRLVGWRNVLFLDDDIYGVEAADARSACTLLRGYNAVCLENVGFPDNSVVCHAFREIVGGQDQFLGAGGLAINPLTTRSFFPRIYNDDWFFLIGQSLPLKVAMTGAMRQKEFDPFADPQRARSEELGDCLGEGLYWLLDHHLSLEMANEAHWTDFLQRRTRLIEYLLLSLPHYFDGEFLRKRQASLEAARQTCKQIQPELCVDFLNEWRSDLATWREFIDATPVSLGVDGALEYLGVTEQAHRSGT